MARGGYRRPKNPAGASPPGASSRRTDGRPGQPIRVATGGPYGQRQALEGQQRAAPLAQTTAMAPLPQAPAALRGSATGLGPAVFGPTSRPHEDALAGLRQPTIIPDDPDFLLRALYALYPHPDIANLIGG